MGTSVRFGGATLMVSAVTAISMLLLTGPGVSAASAASCRHPGGTGFIGGEELIENGFTVSEEQATGQAIFKLADRICPQPEFIELVEGSLYPSHVRHETAWQYTFRARATPGRTYKVTCIIPSLAHMSIKITAMSGKVIYRTNAKTPGI